MHPKELKIEDYTYELPEGRIAKYPLPQRDASKLLVFEKGQLTEDHYSNIAHHIPQGSLMVYNRTRVVQARLLFTKETGGVIEIFCLEPHEQYADVQTAMLQTQRVLWKCLVGGAGKWKHGMVLVMKQDDLQLNAKIAGRDADTFTIELSWNDDRSFAEVLHKAGKVPLPPYLHRDAEVSDDERYQTVYARDEGSVAAPTAGLHFTTGVLQKLKDKGVHSEFVSLHVGAGTFMPVKAETMQDHAMHAEWIQVTLHSVKHLLKHLDDKIIAVGTTSLRTLETLYWIGVKLLTGITPADSEYAVGQWEPYDLPQSYTAHDALSALAEWMMNNNMSELVTRTQILIAPGYKIRVVKGLVTNFHQPQSTLLLLVAAAIGDDWRKMYDYALRHNYRFLSYGDGSLLWI